MLRYIDLYYSQKSEPVKGSMLALRDYILSFDENISEAWKYRMPFFCYKEKMLCYLWTDKRTLLPYIGFVEGKNIDHPDLIQGSRARMKVLNIDPNQDFPVKTIREILTEAINIVSSKMKT